jgi:sugar (pentulose or hexulose) kinase
VQLSLDESGAAGIEFTGAANNDGVLSIRVDSDGLSPARLFDATLQHSSEVLLEVLAHMDAENPPATRSVLAGGWSGMRSVRRSRERILPSLRVSERDEDTAFGAALVAAYAADPTADDLAAYLARGLAGQTPAGSGPDSGTTSVPMAPRESSSR